jgi:DNA-binding MarR family transcriptional regulator
MQTCLLMRIWDNALDERIIRIIENNDGKSYFYQLEKEMGVSRKTLNVHLKRLERQNTIEKDPNPQIGKKRYIRLTFKAILRKSLGILEGAHSGNMSPTRNKKLIRLLFVMVGRSYAGHEYLKDGSIKDRPRRKGPRLVSDFIRSDPGISLDDVVNPNIFTRIVDDFSPEEIAESINRLRKQKIFVPSAASSGDIHFRFDLEYARLLPFINESYLILDILISRMTFKWLRVSRKATPEQIDWFISIVGKREMKNFFSGLDEERRLSFENIIELNKKWLGDSHKEATLVQIKKHDKEFVQKRDLDIKQMIEELKNKYHDVEEQHPVFHELIMEMINPSFLH